MNDFSRIIVKPRGILTKEMVENCILTEEMVENNENNETIKLWVKPGFRKHVLSRVSEVIDCSSPLEFSRKKNVNSKKTVMTPDEIMRAIVQLTSGKLLHGNGESTIIGQICLVDGYVENVSVCFYKLDDKHGLWECNCGELMDPWFPSYYQLELRKN